VSDPGLREGEEIAPGRTVVRHLGGGLRYEAWLTWDDHLRALVVAKVVRADRVGDGDAVDGLAGETAHLQRLAHPMLLRSFGAVLEGPRPHLVLEFIEGPRLSTLIRRYGVILEQLLPLALNLCSVLHYLGREGVVHLDVKPGNVVMAGDPRLIDLSIARRTEELAGMRSPPGTDGYMAPEQCERERFGELGPPADVWGLGVTLYEALARRRPFPDDGERWPQLRHAPEPPPEKLSPAVMEPIMACLAWAPADRPTAAQLGDALEPLVDALPAPRMGRFRPAPRRRPG
jgi:serine/threonine protein kinase